MINENDAQESADPLPDPAVLLNKQQDKASAPDTGINLVIAGAGTGKTKTLIEKVKNIILNNLSKPENILILHSAIKQQKK